MPFKNEHSIRVTQPGQYTKFARKNLTAGVDAVLGIKGGKSEVQALRFDKAKFTPAEARDWADKHGYKGSMHPASDHDEGTPTPAGSSAITVPTAIHKDLSVQYAEIEDLDIDMLVDLIMDKEISLDELMKGIQHETEHTTDRLVAAKIAMDHLMEHSDYYTKLDEAEKTMSHSENKRGIIADAPSPIKAYQVLSYPVNSSPIPSGHFTSGPLHYADSIQYAGSISHKEIEDDLDDEEDGLGYDEEKNELTVEAFSVGTHTSAEGTECTYTEKDLDKMAKEYNERVEKDPSPICLGHPSDSSPAFGWIKHCMASGGKLFMKLHELNRDFVDALRNKAYKKVSLSLYDSENGPRIRHLAFLGGMAPAVKGLSPVQFASSIPYHSFTEEFDMADKVVNVDELKRENHFFKKLFNLFKIDVKTFTEEKPMPDTKTLEVKDTVKVADKTDLGVKDHVEQSSIIAMEEGKARPAGDKSAAAIQNSIVEKETLDPGEATMASPEEKQVKAQVANEATDIAAENEKLKGEVASLKSEVEALKAALAKNHAEAVKQSDKDFCEELIKAGQIRPADRDMIILNLEARATLDNVRHYSEEQSAHRHYREELKKMPKIITFGAEPSVPNMTTPVSVPDVGMANYMKKKVEDKMAATPNISYWDALKASMSECAAEEPEKYAQYMQGMIPPR